MNPPAPLSTPLWPLVVYFFAVLLMAGGMIGLSAVLGQRRMGYATGEPFECGVLPTGSAHLRWDVRFYLIAMFFVIFDLESVFVFAWAVNLRALGWPGYLAMLVFIVILLVALVYLWRAGVFDWEMAQPRPQPPQGDREIYSEGGAKHGVVAEQA